MTGSDIAVLDRSAGLSRLLFGANPTLGALAFGVLVTGASGSVAARGASAASHASKQKQ